jgi:hypothetical protein
MSKLLEPGSDNPKPSRSNHEELPAEERKRLLAALDSARENAKPRVRTLQESEALSNELLNLRLKIANDQAKHTVPGTDD